MEIMFRTVSLPFKKTKIDRSPKVLAIDDVDDSDGSDDVDDGTKEADATNANHTRNHLSFQESLSFIIICNMTATPYFS